MIEHIFSLEFEPGIQRDGTLFASNALIDGQWMRFAVRNSKAVPRKMGGYVRSPGFTDFDARGIYITPLYPDFAVYIGNSTGLFLFIIDKNFDILSQEDVTPADYVPDINTSWTFDVLFSTVGGSATIVAHAAPNLSAIDNNVSGPVYYNTLGSSAPLITSTMPDVSGGVCVLQPYVFSFGNTGTINYSTPNNPNAPVVSQNVAPDKIVAIYPTRGGNSSPAGIAWSLTSVIRITHTGTGAQEFTFDPISSNNSILSSKGIVEYDGRFYWPALDRFLIYTGVIQELPNSRNLNYFFDNINLNDRQKVWGTKITKWGEIWWFYPNKSLDTYNADDPQCNCAVIYNLRTNDWYDTPIPNGGYRVCGYFDPTLGVPVWADKFALWFHEQAFDQVVDGIPYIIPSSFSTNVISLTSVGPGGNQSDISKNISLVQFEPDFLGTGTMYFQVNGTPYAQAPNVSSVLFWNEVDIKWVDADFLWSEAPGEYVFYPSGNVNPPPTQKLTFREQRRQMTFKIVNAQLSGWYEMGKPLIIVQVDDTRP